MHVLKLPYICYGWMLAIHGKLLVVESAEAWRYGPIIPEVYRRYKAFAGDPIDTVPIDRADMLDDRQAGLIRSVLKAYRKFDSRPGSCRPSRTG